MRGFTHPNHIVYTSAVVGQAQPWHPNFLPANSFNASPRGVSHTPIKRMVYRRRKLLIFNHIGIRGSFNRGMVQMAGLLGDICDGGCDRLAQQFAQKRSLPHRDQSYPAPNHALIAR